MKPQRLAICPCCREFYAPRRDPYTTSCETCNVTLKPVNYDFGLYSALSDEKKKEFKAKYIAEHFPHPYIKPFEPMPLSGWSSYIGCCGVLLIVAAVIAGIFSFLSGSILFGLIMIIAGPASGGVLLLLSVIADDVRHIRNDVNKLQYDAKLEKAKRTD